MCGSIKRSKTPEEAVQFAIARGVFDHADDVKYYGPEEADKVMSVRFYATGFINGFTPSGHRYEALRQLGVLTDDQLVTKLKYREDVIEY